MEDHKKFTMAELVVGGLLMLGIDAAAFVLDFIPGVGWLVATLLQAAGSVSTTMWLKIKGEKRAWGLERQFIKQLSNLLPWVPTCFAALMIEAAIHNNPKLARFAKAGKMKI